jgi:hypothetical protein
MCILSAARGAIVTKMARQSVCGQPFNRRHERDLTVHLDASTYDTYLDTSVIYSYNSLVDEIEHVACSSSRETYARGRHDILDLCVCGCLPSLTVSAAAGIVQVLRAHAIALVVVKVCHVVSTHVPQFVNRLHVSAVHVLNR